MPNTLLTQLLGLLLCFPILGVAQQTSSTPHLFESAEVLHLNIHANLKELLKDKGEDPGYHPATITYKDADGKEVKIDTDAVKLRIRGNFRRKNCSFPPIRVNFDTDKVGGTLFEGQDKLKLVTHCDSRKEIFEQYLLQEYMIYKMYNLISDYSFRVRLLKITYVDSAQRYETIEKYGFLIEDEDLMAARLGGKINTLRLHPDATNQSQTGPMAIFQYMIGNTDWSIPNQHNVKMLQGATTMPIAIPYDFDWSGFIAPPYARPNPLLGTTTVKQRVFRGFCRSESTFQKDLTPFREQKDEILNLVKNREGLTEKMRARSLDYLQDFFDIIENPKAVKRDIMDKCRKGG